MNGIDIALISGHVLMMFNTETARIFQMCGPDDDDNPVQRKHPPGHSLLVVLQDMDDWCLDHLLAVKAKSNPISQDMLENLNIIDRVVNDGSLALLQQDGRLHATLRTSKDVDIPIDLFNEVEADGDDRFWTDDRGVLFGVSKNKDDGKVLASVIAAPPEVNDPWEKDVLYRGTGATLLQCLNDLTKDITREPTPHA